MVKPFIEVTFSYGEYAFLALLLAGPSSPLLPQLLFSQFSLEERTLLLRSAERSLVERKFIAVDAGVGGKRKITVETAVYALVGICSSACSLILRRDAGGTVEERYYSADEEMVVEQSTPTPGNYVLKGFRSMKDTLAYLGEVLLLDGQTAPSGQAGGLSQSSYAIVQDLIAADARRQAIYQLAKEGFDRDSATSIVTTLAALRATNTMIFFRYREGSEMDVHTYMAIQGEQGFWVLDNSIEDKLRLNIRPITASSLRELLGEQFTESVKAKVT